MNNFSQDHYRNLFFELNLRCQCFNRLIRVLRVIRLPVLSLCSTRSAPRVLYRAQISRAFRGRRAGRGGRRSAQRPRQEAACAVLQGADHRAGAPLPAAAVPVRHGEGAPGRPNPPHPEPGENLVPEPPLQDEASSGRAQHGGATAAPGPQGRHPGSGAGREALRPDHSAELGGNAQVRPASPALCLQPAAASRIRPRAARPAAAAPGSAAAGAHVPVELVKPETLLRETPPTHTTSPL